MSSLINNVVTIYSKLPIVDNHLCMQQLGINLIPNIENKYKKQIYTKLKF